MLRANFAAASAARFRSGVVLTQGLELGERLPEDGDDLVDLAAVDPHLGIAIVHGVDRLVLLQPVALEAEALRELLDLGDEDEIDVLFAEVALALRAVDGTVLGPLHQLEDELALALRALEDFRQHESIVTLKRGLRKPNRTEEWES